MKNKLKWNLNQVVIYRIQVHEKKTLAISFRLYGVALDKNKTCWVQGICLNTHEILLYRLKSVLTFISNSPKILHNSLLDYHLLYFAWEWYARKNQDKTTSQWSRGDRLRDIMKA